MGYISIYRGCIVIKRLGTILPDLTKFSQFFYQIQFELGRTSTTLPLSSAVLLNSGKHSVPQFPPRLKVQCLKPNQWARVPNVDLKAHALKLSDIRGWSLLCEDSIQVSISLFI
jgi:hypothetical protein